MRAAWEKKYLPTQQLLHKLSKDISAFTYRANVCVINRYTALGRNSNQERSFDKVTLFQSFFFFLVLFFKSKHQGDGDEKTRPSLISNNRTALPKKKVKNHLETERLESSHFCQS